MAEIQDRPEVAEKATPETTRITLAIEGMTCASCAMRIEKGLKKVAGVEDAAVNLATERATVTLDPTIATTDDLIAEGARDRLRRRAVRRARRGHARTGAQTDSTAD